MENDIEIIKEICWTYNIELYEGLSEISKKTIEYFIFSKVKSKTKSSQATKALISMFYNYLKFKKISPTKYEILQGPIAIWELKSNKYGMHVYLFGDIHSFYGDRFIKANNKRTKRIDDFLYDTIKNSSKFIDLFIEEPYHKSKTPHKFKGDTFIKKIHNKFVKCSSVDKTLCKLPNMRYHYSDLRDMTKLIDSCGKSVKIKITKLKDEFYRKSNLTNLISYLEIIYESLIHYESFKEIFDFYFKSEKLQKQIDKIYDPIIKLKLIKWSYWCVINNTSHSTHDYNWCVKFIKGIIHSLKNNNINLKHLEHLFNILHYIIDSTSCILDIYILARMFRTFTHKKGYYSYPAKNIMIYSGVLHSRNQLNFLLDVGFEIIFKTGLTDLDIYSKNHNIDVIYELLDNKINPQYLNISKLTQPLFSN